MESAEDDLNTRLKWWLGISIILAVIVLVMVLYCYRNSLMGFGRRARGAIRGARGRVGGRGGGASAI